MIACSRLTDRLRNAVFDRAREDLRNRVRDPVYRTTVVHYGHVTHIRYDFPCNRYDFFHRVKMDVFVLPSRILLQACLSGSQTMLTVANEIITVYALHSRYNFPTALMAELREVLCPPLQEKVNAATVLWRFVVLCESRTLTSMLPLIRQ